MEKKNSSKDCDLLGCAIFLMIIVNAYLLFKDHQLEMRITELERKNCAIDLKEPHVELSWDVKEVQCPSLIVPSEGFISNSGSMIEFSWQQTRESVEGFFIEN